MEKAVIILTPLEKAEHTILKNPLSIISAVLLTLGGIALTAVNYSDGLFAALLLLNLIAVCVSAGTAARGRSALSFRKAIALTDFIVFTVLTFFNTLHNLFPNEEFILFKSGDNVIALIPDSSFFDSTTIWTEMLIGVAAVYFLLRLISDSSLKSAVAKNLPKRGAHIFCGLWFIITAVLCAASGVFVLPFIPMPLSLRPTFETYYIMYTVLGSFAAFTIASLLEAVRCFVTFSKLRKTEHAF